MDPNIALVFILIGAVVSGVIANSKRRNVAGYAVLGALFPLIGIIAIACLPAIPPPGVTTQQGY